MGESASTSRPGESFARQFAGARRIVVKVGSAVVAPKGELEIEAVQRLARGIVALATDAGGARQVMLVSSGAVASGFRSLGLGASPKTIVLKQAAAAIGQSRLMSAYAGAFAPRDVAQVLLTSDDLDHRARVLNARRTLAALLDHGVTPIINENDSVSFDEIKLGDNDRLSALVAAHMQADLLIILSTVRGVYAGGDARRIISCISPGDDPSGHVQAEKSATGVGGMATKIAAARVCTSAGIPVVIAGGGEPDVLERVIRGEEIGTYFPAPVRRTPLRKRWIGQSTRAKGKLIIDEGATKAIRTRGASLLPSGVLEVKGHFAAGAAVDILGPDQHPIARGLASYSAEEIRKIRGKRAAQIAAILGYNYRDEVVHRDDLMLLA